MQRLVKVNKKNIAEYIGKVLIKYPQVAAAYLFGSALNQCRPESDIDLGIILEDELRPGSREWDLLEARVAMDLLPFDGHPFDVVSLNPNDTLFVFKVLKEGELIYCRDMDHLTDFIEYISRRYSDIYPRYKMALQEVFKEVIAGGSGL